MSNKKRIILITILSIMLVALLTAFVFATINFASSKKAHAEYDDITSETVVNFNQLVYMSHENYNNYGLTLSITDNEINLDGTPDFALTFDVGNIKLINGHKYYCNCDNVNIYFNIYQQILFNEFPYIAQATSTGTFGTQIIVQRVTYNNDVVHINIIDLTQMFGEGNEPNIEQCQLLFKSNYYNYTLGQAMFFGLNANDMFQNLDYSFNTGLVSGYPQNITQSNVQYGSNGALQFTAVHQDNYTPYWLINFKTTIPKGSIITINLNSYTTFTGVGFAFAYVNSEETYIDSIPTNQSQNKPYSYSFMAQEDLSAIYLIEQGSSTWTNGTILTIYNGSINVQLVNDYKFNLQTQYDLGYSDAETYYTDGYGRQIIWSEGYNVGYTRGVSEGSLSDGWTFLSTLFGGIGSIFSLEIFPNITVGTFVMIPLLLGLVFFIVKLSRGGS